MPNHEKLEAKSRLGAMVDDNGGTWDLSDNDKAALKTALSMMETDLAIDQVCEDLPEDYEVQIRLEAGSGIIELYGPDSECSYDTNAESFTEQLRDAYEGAKQLEQV